MSSPELQHDIEQFYYREALLLDRNQFEEWRGFFLPDARYVISARRIGEPPGEGVEKTRMAPLIDDDVDFLAVRVQRFASGLVHARQPPPRTRRFINNVLILRERPDELEVVSNILLLIARQEESEKFFVGQREDVLRRGEGEWRVASRTAILDHVLLPGLITFFI
jgi:biphenyl 2,3-dioxygenase beta subunit